MNAYAIIERSKLMGIGLSATDEGLSITCQSTPDTEAMIHHLEFHESAIITALQTPPTRIDKAFMMVEQSLTSCSWWRIPPTEQPGQAIEAPEAPAVDYDAMIGQIVTAQQFYELQQATAAHGWTLRGERAGAIIDGYCDDWRLTRLVTAEKQ